MKFAVISGMPEAEGTEVNFKLNLQRIRRIFLIRQEGEIRPGKRIMDQARVLNRGHLKENNTSL